MFAVFQKYISERVSLTDDEFKAIEAVSTLKKLRKKQYLLQEGDVWRFNAFITKGCVRTYRVDDEGGEHILQFSIENWWTGDRESLMSGKPSRCNIDALEDSELILIGKEDFEGLLKNIPAFQDMVTQILEKSFIASQNRIHAAISYTAEEKYMNFIKTYPDLSNRVPQSMIASFLGISPETLSRVRNQVSKK